MTSLYQKLGGEATLKHVVNSLYQKILADKFLAPVFVPYDMNRLKRSQVEFFAQALGGGSTYYGRDMGTAHAHLNLTNRHFDEVVEYLVKTLEEFHVQSSDIETILKALSPLRKDIVTREG